MSSKGSPGRKALERRRDSRRALRQRAELRVVLLAAKNVPCADCRLSFPVVCMDFDHLDSSKKLVNVSRLLSSGRSLNTLRIEMAKCEVVCANCHRIRTHARRQHLAPRAVATSPQLDMLGNPHATPGVYAATPPGGTGGT